MRAHRGAECRARAMEANGGVVHGNAELGSRFTQRVSSGIDERKDAGIARPQAARLHDAAAAGGIGRVDRWKLIRRDRLTGSAPDIGGCAPQCVDRDVAMNPIEPGQHALGITQRFRAFERPDRSTL